MVSRALLALIVLAGCGAGHDAPAGDDAPTVDAPGGSTDAFSAPRSLVPGVIAALGAEVAQRSPGTDLAIAFIDLSTTEHAELAADITHVSASSAKAYWVAAALDGAGLAAVAPHADAIFRNSDNDEAGAVIDLIGPDAVNTYLWSTVGLTATALTQWSFGHTRIATNSPRLMGGDNYTTAGDAATFLEKLARANILGDARGDALRRWLTLSPNSGVGGWLVARLPAEVQGSVEHKAGWLPPGCCGDDATYNTLNEMGIVTAPSGHAYVVAILARRGTDYWGKQAPFVEYASCAIYRAFVRDDAIRCD